MMSDDIEQTKQTKQTAEQKHAAVVEALGDAIPAGIDPNGHPTEQVVATTVSTMRCEIERLRAAYDGLTPAQYHAGLSTLWAALGNPPMDGRDVFTRVADTIVGLQAIIAAKLHQRRCHDCGHVGWYADSRTPYCLCDNCRSQDTRLVKEEK